MLNIHDIEEKIGYIIINYILSLLIILYKIIKQKEDII